jgi:putative phage-type endonuclease
VSVVLAFAQRSPEWYQARVGCVTGSRIVDVMATVKNGEAAGRANYRAEIIAERLTGEPAEDGFESAAMRRGTEQEPYARGAYEARQGVNVEQVGFVFHPTIPFAGCSPDGLVAPDGGVEIKAPNTANHIETVIKQEIPSRYLKQMNWAMACTGAAWWDFASFDDRLPSDIELFVKRLHRDDAAIAAIETEVRRFLAEVDEYIEKLMKGSR